jgi:hypothetical protein
MISAKVGSTPPVEDRKGGKLQNRELARTVTAAISAPSPRMLDFERVGKRSYDFMRIFIDINTKFRN